MYGMAGRKGKRKKEGLMGEEGRNGGVTEYISDHPSYT